MDAPARCLKKNTPVPKLTWAIDWCLFRFFLFWLINTSYFIQNGEQKQYVYCPLDRLHDDFSRKDVFVILSSLVVKSKESFLPFSWPMGRLRECQAGALKVSSQSWPQEQTWSPGHDVAVVARATCCPHLSRCQTCCLPVITDQRLSSRWSGPGEGYTD